MRQEDDLVRNEELEIRNGGKLFCKKLLSNKSIAKQCILTFFTLHSSLLTKKQKEAFCFI